MSCCSKTLASAPLHGTMSVTAGTDSGTSQSSPPCTRRDQEDAPGLHTSRGGVVWQLSIVRSCHLCSPAFDVSPVAGLDAIPAPEESLEEKPGPVSSTGTRNNVRSAGDDEVHQINEAVHAQQNCGDLNGLRLEEVSTASNNLLRLVARSVRGNGSLAEGKEGKEGKGRSQGCMLLRRLS